MEYLGCRLIWSSTSELRLLTPGIMAPCAEIVEWGVHGEQDQWNVAEGSGSHCGGPTSAFCSSENDHEFNCLGTSQHPDKTLSFLGCKQC